MLMEKEILYRETAKWSKESRVRSAQKAACRDRAVKRFDKGNIRHAGDDDSAEPPKAVAMGVANEPMRRAKQAGSEKSGHDRPFDPADGNVSAEIGEDVLRQARSESMAPKSGKKENDDAED